MEKEITCLKSIMTIIPFVNIGTKKKRDLALNKYITCCKTEEMVYLCKCFFFFYYCVSAVIHSAKIWVYPCHIQGVPLSEAWSVQIVLLTYTIVKLTELIQLMIKKEKKRGDLSYKYRGKYMEECILKWMNEWKGQWMEEWEGVGVLLCQGKTE